jgi:hypothetical protein
LAALTALGHGEEACIHDQVGERDVCQAGERGLIHLSLHLDLVQEGLRMNWRRRKGSGRGGRENEVVSSQHEHEFSLEGG